MNPSGVQATDSDANYGQAKSATATIKLGGVMRPFLACYQGIRRLHIRNDRLCKMCSLSSLTSGKPIVNKLGWIHATRWRNLKKITTQATLTLKTGGVACRISLGTPHEPHDIQKNAEWRSSVGRQFELSCSGCLYGFPWSCRACCPYGCPCCCPSRCLYGCPCCSL